ncbi:hypothetical protein [Sporomusa sp.]|uniref:hypothetical protein n=1 Tax=Sporomusa sp. TaxID=2078658 RepID=UPI002B831EB0|nr:hypothetical protein [Sporomusa sp.]HWR06161.1 hypothetical protein [Sporomusa sp.]
MKYNELSQIKSFIDHQTQAWDQINKLVKHVQSLVAANPDVKLPSEEKMGALSEMERIERGACEAIKSLISSCEPALKAEHEATSKAAAEKRRAEAKTVQATKAATPAAAPKKPDQAKKPVDPGFIDLFADVEVEAS